MQRTYSVDFKRGGFFEQCLNLCAEFPHDSEVIAACFASPALRVVVVVRAEFAECVRGEKRFFCGVISHNDFGPVYVRGSDE